MYIQSRFSQNTLERIFSDFQINNGESVLYAVWLKTGRHGFVFTDKRFYWNINTSIIRNSEVTQVRLPSNIMEKNVNSLKVKIVTKDPFQNASRKSKYLYLALSSHIGLIRFDTTKLTYDEALRLRKIFNQYINESTLPEPRHKPFVQRLWELKDVTFDFFWCLKNGRLFKRSRAKSLYDSSRYEEDQEQNSVAEEEEAEERVPAEQSADLAQNRSVGQASSGQEQDLPESSVKEAQDVQSNNEEVAETEGDSAKKEKKELSYIPGIHFHILDVLTALFYATAVLFAVKPILFAKSINNVLSSAGRFFADIGRIFFFADKNTIQRLSEMEIRSDYITILVDKRNCVFVVFIILYVMSRIVLILRNRSANKKLSYVFLTLLTVVCVFIPIKFSIFFILAIALAIAMQWAGGSTKEAAVCKIFAFILCFGMEYYLVHLLLYPGFPDVMANVVQILGLHAKW